MAEITAAVVKSLRDKTGLPMMECKQALAEAGGDEEQAVRLLREKGAKTMASRQDRTTEEGRIAVFTSPTVGAMVEVLCESAPVATNEEFVALVGDMAKALATSTKAISTGDELLALPSTVQNGKAIKDIFENVTNRMREVFRITRLVKIDGACGGYVHHDGKTGVLVEVKGANAEGAKNAAMHIAALRPTVVAIEDLDPADVAREREILAAAAKNEGKPDAIIPKMVEGRMRNYYAQTVLNEQPYVKDDKQTVGAYLKSTGGTAVRFVFWQLGK